MQHKFVFLKIEELSLMIFFICFSGGIKFSELNKEQGKFVKIFSLSMCLSACIPVSQPWPLCENNVFFCFACPNT